MKNEYINWIELDLDIHVEEKEKAGRQIKFYGEIVRGNCVWKEGEMVETPFLYKSGWKKVKR